VSSREDSDTSERPIEMVRIVLFYTPPPEEKSPQVKSAIANEAGAVGPVTWEPHLATGAEEQTEFPVVYIDPIGRH
jgi:hypothetical protein